MRKIVALTAITFFTVAMIIMAVPSTGLACHINVNGWMTDTEGRPVSGNTFNVVVNKRGIISSTNPGGFFYNIEVSTNEWALNSLTISVLLPLEFNTHSGKAVKVFVNGSQVYNGSSLSVTVNDIPAGSTVTMMVHLKYALIKDLAVGPYPQTCTFDAVFSVDPDYAVYGSAAATLTATTD